MIQHKAQYTKHCVLNIKQNIDLNKGSFQFLKKSVHKV